MSSFTTPREVLPSPPSPDERSGSQSPIAPPYSPITPVLSTTTLVPTSASYSYAQAKGITDYPPPVPISESENPDAIAVRATLSLLQLQRLRAIRDLQTLEKQKRAALADPKAYVRAIQDGQVRKAPENGLLGQSLDLDSLSDCDEDDTEDHDGATKITNEEVNEQSDADFWEVPRSQNVVRCPPVNWAKYHVSGEPFQKLHEDQRRRPTGGGRQQDELARDHVVLAPYSPWKDKLLESSVKTRSESKRA